ncbi:FAD-linked reductase [Rhizodiscina lignyota]|uniref:FAD-linked reductase n=1 Tax=Rhizodiscina lignyota TaxID=1504668 RepID=A0A9P4IQY5_9PEZI|nr:FAD-linked reductase [Rhizodiscina lignyota]
MALLAAVVSPMSTGSVHIYTTDPSEQPLIDPAWLGSEFDQQLALETIRNAVTLVTSSPLDSFTIGPFGDFATALAAETDEALLSYMRSQGTTIWHAFSNTRMSPYGTDYGVVNPDFAVKGIKGLRILDAGVFPTLPTCHPMGVVWVFAERAADLIKRKYGNDP